MSEKLNNVLSNERIDNARKRIAKCLNMLETTTQEVRWACESEKWNDEVVFQIEEAATKLGYALATLYRWDDPEESFKDEI
jgi:hypothetical protein